MNIKSHTKGFTLIEIIVVIVIIGIIGVFGSLFLVNMIKSYQWAEDNAHLTQKAQVALTRIAVEMAYADADSVDEDELDNNVIKYNATYPDGTQESGNRFELSGSSLMYENDDDQYVLADHVDSFAVDVDNWGDGYFEVSLTMTGANNVEQIFRKTIALP